VPAHVVAPLRQMPVMDQRQCPLTSWHHCVRPTWRPVPTRTDGVASSLRVCFVGGCTARCASPLSHRPCPPPRHPRQTLMAHSMARATAAGTGCGRAWERRSPCTPSAARALPRPPTTRTAPSHVPSPPSAMCPPSTATQLTQCPPMPHHLHYCTARAVPSLYLTRLAQCPPTIAHTVPLPSPPTAHSATAVQISFH
jgi:hypothetical protein